MYFYILASQTGLLAERNSQRINLVTFEITTECKVEVIHVHHGDLLSFQCSTSVIGDEANPTETRR